MALSSTRTSYTFHDIPIEDRGEDIGETKNLVDSEPEKRAELSAKLSAWQEEIEALIPEPHPEYGPWEG